MLVALSKHLPLPLGPLEAEAKAMDEAASFATDIGLQEAIFETDCAVLAGSLSDTTQAPITFENIISGIHLKLQTFRQYRVVHVQRQDNKPAHTMVQHAKGINNFVSWIEETPSFVDSLVL